MRKKNNKCTYIRSFCNYTINILFTAVLIFVGICIYKLIYNTLISIPNLSNIYGNLISSLVTIIIALVSYMTKIKIYLSVLLHKIKQKVYQFICWKHNHFFKSSVTNYNENHLLTSKEQEMFVTSAIHILKNNTKNTILISGSAGRGKTTSVMLLLNVIAHDSELFQIFSELQNRIVYFDSINDKDVLIECIRRVENQKNRLIIIDNIQKHTISSINEIMYRISTMTSYNQNINKNILVVLLYQETSKNNAFYEYIVNNYFKTEENIFKINCNVNFETKSLSKSKVSQNKDFITNVQKIKEPIFKQHINYIIQNHKDDSILTLLNNLIFKPSSEISTKNERVFFVLISAIFIGSYNGYITKKELHSLWTRNYSFASLLQADSFIQYYVRNRVLISFPFVRSSYIFNEQLARHYRKALIDNKFFREKSYMIAESIFTQCEENMPQKWLLFLLCSPTFCVNYSQCERMRYFENVLSSYHLQYIIDLVENELSILPEKKDIFRQELGIIYVYNGEWVKAKHILYPYIKNNDINKDIWHIQLKIIETEHGCSDESHLEMLSYMEGECTEPNILFQIKYWREHIRMEHGRFSLKTWKELVWKMKNDDDLEKLRTDDHFFKRLISDYERVYFLKGKINYNNYQNILSEYMQLSNINSYSSEPLEYILSQAYYVQYDVLYQLGIWGYANCGNINPDIISNPSFIDDGDIISNLLQITLDKYEFCIRKYQSEGKKKYRTLEIRKAELTMCTDLNCFVEVLNQIDKFEQYAKQNNITVFEGYCNTQRGKAFALYAEYMFRMNEFYRFEEYLKKAENCLMVAQEIYEKYDNPYGAFRAELLIILINMIQDRDNKNRKHTNIFQNKYHCLLIQLSQKYNNNKQYAREHDIIEYLLKNIVKIELPLKILKFYPIILQ